MAIAPLNISIAAMRASLWHLVTPGFVGRDIQNIQIVRIEIVVILRVGGCRGDHLAHGFGARVGQILENRQGICHRLPFDGVRHQAHLARRDTDISCNSSYLHFTPLLADRRGLLTLAARMTTEMPRGGKLAEFMTYHV